MNPTYQFEAGTKLAIGFLNLKRSYELLQLTADKDGLFFLSTGQYLTADDAERIGNFFLEGAANLRTKDRRVGKDRRISKVKS